MIKKMLATTALVALMAGPAVVMSGSDAVVEEARGTKTIQTYGTLDAREANGYLASNLMGRSVYTSTAADAERIGEIDDAIVGQDGRINAVILGVGGFLGLGEKPVAMSFQRVELYRDGDDSIFVTVPYSEEQLEVAAEYDAETFAKNAEDTMLTPTKIN